MTVVMTIYWTRWVFLVQWILLFWGVCGFLGSHVAGLRDEDRLDGFKTGLLFGPIGVVVFTFKKARVPDIEVVCPALQNEAGGRRLSGLVRMLAVREEVELDQITESEGDLDAGVAALRSTKSHVPGLARVTGLLRPGARLAVLSDVAPKRRCVRWIPPSWPASSSVCKRRCCAMYTGILANFGVR